MQSSSRKGVCAPIGFFANGVHCGIRKNRSKPDLALIVSECPAAAAAIYTQNLVKGAPLFVTRNHLEDNTAQAIICNSGNANTCNADGIKIAEGMCALVQTHCGIRAENVLVASTGVIGQPLSLNPIAGGMQSLKEGLSVDGTAAAEAIMTTDTFSKQTSVAFDVGGVTCTIGGMGKGSGMIHPNMATMLVFITSDIAIAPALLRPLLKEIADDTFNMITVDGDTSTNDNVILLANGMAGNREITSAQDAGYAAFKDALLCVMTTLSKMLAGDGEGATHLIACRVSGAKTKTDARAMAKGVVGSSLLKAAIFGSDANWGRVLCAIGYCGADVDVQKIGVAFQSINGEVMVCKNGAGVPFSEEIAKHVLSASEITIQVTAQDGNAAATAWGCDLTYDYVKINGDYRT
ncbi:MAG: bifunctional glutamate N-acetyltransferase/amino-acid acetyltransferase ArgJ [Oscillospiraceae bacterium]|jgi:glutamate N-acetyltransferase/amino-acid N-acetyltransferase|nr:bifunctional glutamate N-acetyltransferase/amino-acid acetyltransferase ArgJ [Oscillospiraceae bacterium]